MPAIRSVVDVKYNVITDSINPSIVFKGLIILYEINISRNIHSSRLTLIYRKKTIHNGNNVFRLCYHRML